MKAILTATSANGLPAVIPDSALGRNRQPLFLPDDFENFQARIVLAAKIGRLGKNISRKFALRYFDGLALGCVMEPKPSQPFDPLLFIRDSTAVIGAFFNPGEVNSPSEIMVEKKSLSDTGGIEKHRVVLDSAEDILAAWLSGNSFYTTFKTGDLILIPLNCIIVPQPDFRIRGSLEGKESLCFHFK